MHHIVFLDRDSLQADLRRPAFAHDWAEYPATRPDEVVARLREAFDVTVEEVVIAEEHVVFKLPAALAR